MAGEVFKERAICLVGESGVGRELLFDNEVLGSDLRRWGAEWGLGFPSHIPHTRAPHPASHGARRNELSERWKTCDMLAIRYAITALLSPGPAPSLCPLFSPTEGIRHS